MKAHKWWMSMGSCFMFAGLPKNESFFCFDVSISGLYTISMCMKMNLSFFQNTSNVVSKQYGIFSILIV